MGGMASALGLDWVCGKSSVWNIAGLRLWAFVDKHPRLPVLILVLLPFLVHLPHLLLGLSTDPVWLTSGAVHGTRSGALGGLPYLDPHAGYTSQALGNLAAWDWLHGRVPWWNPYSGIGLPLAGGMTPGAFFMPFVLLLLLPGGVLWLKVAMMILAGLATYALLGELGLGRLASATGAMLYELNGTFAWMPGGCLTAPIPFLPLLLYGIERSRRAGGKGPGILLVGAGICGGVLAGFPEMAYISGLFALLWALYRFAGEEKRWRFAGRILYGGMLGLLVAAPLLVAFADYLLVSNTFTSHELGGKYLTGTAAAALVLPYVYGPLHTTHGNVNLLPVWNRAGGYASALLILWAVAGAFGRWERGLRHLLGFWVLISWAKTYGIQPVMGLMNHVPFLLQTAFYRYAQPSWEMALVLLAAFAIEDVKRVRRRFPVLPFLFVSGSVVLCSAVAFPWRPFWGWQGGPPSAMVRWFSISLVWALGGLAAMFWAWRHLSGERRRLTLAAILVGDACALLVAPTLSGVHAGVVDWPAVRFLQEHAGLCRFYTLAPIQPNYGAYFKIASINHNGLPVAADWEAHITKSLFPPLKECRGGAVFWPAWYHYRSESGKECLFRFLSNYQDLAVRYVVTNPEEEPVPSSPLRAGRHGRGLSGPIAASMCAAPVSSLGYEQPGDEMAGIRKVYSDSVLAIWELPNPAPYYSVFEGGIHALSGAQRESVVVKCDAPVTLVRRELFMPGWRATINGKSATVSRFGEVFQCVHLPVGENAVRFHFEPPYVGYGWAFCALGLVGLGWELAAMVRMRRQSERLSAYA